MDTYLEKSIKEGTRRQRGGQPGPRTQLTSAKQKMPQGENWIKYLNNIENKNNLVSFFVEYLKLSHVREGIYIFSGMASICTCTCILMSRYINPFLNLFLSFMIFQNRNRYDHEQKVI